jgi:hypothetical protein
VLAPDPGRFVGSTYAALLAGEEREALLATLTAERFSGWVGPHDEGWCVAVPEAPAGHVARRRRRVRDLAELLAAGSAGPVVGILVERDEVLRLWAGTRDGELIDYVSDVSTDAGEEAWTVDDFGNPVPPPEGPAGAHRAGALARALHRPEAADDLAALLTEPLGESTSESERLGSVAALLGWPSWLVAVGSLPRQIPGGPDRRRFMRLRAGRRGLVGVLASRAAGVGRRRG